MKTVILGVFLVLGSTSVIVDKNQVYENSSMMTIKKDEVIPRKDMTVKVSPVLMNLRKERSTCSDTGCWNNIIQNSSK